MTTMNAHSLFLGSRQLPAFHQAIAACPIAHARLVAADKKIRAALRAAAKEVAGSEIRLVALATRHFVKDHGKPVFDVRFLWQGSKVYKTDIDPAEKPPQQSDLDDGVYLRTSFLENTDPAIASERFFQFVENALRPLCIAEGWKLITDKNTCVRIEIGDDLHLDLPLYAIPDDEFTTLEKAAMRTFGTDLSEQSGNVLVMLDRERSLRIDPDRVMLAHRKLGWIVSDPRALHDWFEEKAAEFGAQLKRICRYFKAWRDYTFLSGGPESITLMVCAVIVFEEMRHQLDDDRDDKTFLFIAERLPKLFRSDIENPVLPDNGSVLNNWNDVERQSFIKAAEELHRNADQALNGTMHQNITIDRFIESLGDRFPQRPDLVKVEVETKSATSLSTPAIPAALTPVRSTTSG
ncbi:MAG: CBASS cGAMP synthase [Ahrensia sp.]|nr:CBASS cGAMP synthase [Ahrensia sp.]